MNDYQEIADEAIALCKKFYNICIDRGFEPFGLANVLGAIYYKYIASILDHNMEELYSDDPDKYEAERLDLFRIMENTFMMVPGTLEKDLGVFTTDRIKEGLCDFGGSEMIPIIDKWCDTAKEQFSERLG